MIDFDDLDDAEDAGDADQKASTAAAQKAWEEEKQLEQRRKEEAAREKEEAAARLREQARIRRQREEREQQEREALRLKQEQERAKKDEARQRAPPPAKEEEEAPKAMAREAPPARRAPAGQVALPAHGGSGDTKDLALGRPAEASSSKAPDRGPSCAVDGNPQTRWTSAYDDNQWLSVDLGQLCRISGVAVRWEAAYAESYLVQGSVDGNSLDTLATATGAEGWILSNVPPDSCAVRWVSIYCTKRATDFGFSIWELVVYGKALAPTAAPVAPLGQQAAERGSHRREGPPAPRQDGEQRGVTPAPVRDASADAIMAAVGRPYEVLGLEPGASSASIRRAYHMLALRFHPDKAGDDEVFRVIAAAYKALTEARDQDTETGWRDMEGQAVGPWQAHGAAANVVLFDTFGAPPWESRRLYTGCWNEAIVRCWELSKGEPGKVRPPPRLLGQIDVGGFINDLAAISPHGLVTAQSAGMMPQPGESLRVYDVSRTPFLRPPKGTANAIEDGADGPGKMQLEGPKAKGQAQKGENRLAVRKQEDPEDEEEARRRQEGQNRDDVSEKVFLHSRGCHALSLWPRPDSRDASPFFVASASKDHLGVSRITEGGGSLEIVWKKPDPHRADVNALCWDGFGKLWSGGNNGAVMLWDVASGREEPLMNFGGGSGHIYRLEVWPDASVMVSAHSSGIAYLDSRSGAVIHNQYTSKSPKALACLRTGHPKLFVGLGNDLNEYDTRMFAGGFQKPKAVGQWTLRAQVVSLNCTSSAKGHLLVAAGCEDGKVAAFDTT